jgi:hypothetical protein
VLDKINVFHNLNQPLLDIIRFNYIHDKRRRFHI